MNLQIGEYLSLRLSIEKARFGCLPQELFGIAVRKNRNRPFLFVSKVLGKHLPAHPALLLGAGKLLSAAYTGQENAGYFAALLKENAEISFKEVWRKLEESREDIPKSETTLIVGFAETATGLAQAVANSFKGHVGYIHSSRLFLPEEESISFEEAHSHAKGHSLYLKKDNPFLHACKRVILVDDELTTGKTALRLIREMVSCFGIREYVIFTILNWSDENDRKELEKELSIKIEVISLLQGKIEAVSANPPKEMEIASIRNPSCAEIPFPLTNANMSACVSRTLTFPDELELQKCECEKIADKIGSKKKETLFLGTGELIYVPALIAGLTGGSYFHSTTQSPIYPLNDSAVVSGIQFDSPDVYSSIGYLYNVPPQKYEGAVLFTEQKTLDRRGISELCSYLQCQGISDVEVIAL